MKRRHNAPWSVPDLDEALITRRQNPACKTCLHLNRARRRDSLTFCMHPDAKGVANTSENTGYVEGKQPRTQPSWCPLLLIDLSGKPLTPEDFEKVAELIRREPLTTGRMPSYKTMSKIPK